MPTQRREPTAEDLKATLRPLADRLTEGKRVRAGTFHLRVTGKGGGDLQVRCADGRAEVLDGPPEPAKGPRVEIIGKPRVLRAILAGEKDARKQFLAGGFRVRGDLRYLSEVAMELELLDKPI